MLLPSLYAFGSCHYQLPTSWPPNAANLTRPKLSAWHSKSSRWTPQFLDLGRPAVNKIKKSAMRCHIIYYSSSQYLNALFSKIIVCVNHRIIESFKHSANLPEKVVFLSHKAWLYTLFLFLCFVFFLFFLFELHRLLGTSYLYFFGLWTFVSEQYTVMWNQWTLWTSTEVLQHPVMRGCDWMTAIDY